MSDKKRIESDIEARLRAMDPAVELVAVQFPGHEALRVFVDHPGGVDLALCERVTRELGDLTASFALEVSSPGLDRPLTKPEHFRRFIGRQVRVRTARAVEGRRNFTGTLTEADDESVSLATDGEPVRIPLEWIHRSNLVPDFGFGGQA